uniref:Alpha-galactosidase n=1 Tax=Cannabis sativa TaxID=3483 RepID=A0A803PH02_CANSA
MDCDEPLQQSKKRFTQNSGSHSPKRAMAELRHSSSIGARSSSSPMKRDEDSSPLISDTQSDDDARGRHVHKDRGDRSFCSYFHSLCPFLNEDVRVSTQSSRISLFLLVFVVLVASISIFSVVRRLNTPYLCRKDGIVLHCPQVKESPSLWENPLSATTSWKPCAERRDGGLSDVPPENETNGYIFIHAEGGLNQQRIAICNAVAVAKIMNATLILPVLKQDQIWKDKTNFEDIFDVDHFIDYLKDDVRIVRDIPEWFTDKTELFTSIRRTVKNIPKYAPAQFYIDNVLPRVKEKKIMALKPFVDRLGYDNVPSEINRLRCRVNYHALKFLPEIEQMADLLAARMRNRTGGSNPYMALHLRFEKGMVGLSFCDFVATREEKASMAEYRKKEWPRRYKNGSHLWQLALQKRKEGRCPLEPGEVAVILRAMGYPKETQIYVASGQVYGGQNRMAPLRNMFPNLVTKQELATKEELDKFRKHVTSLAALDFLVCLKSDVFVMTHGGNFAKLIIGARRYMGHRQKSIKPDKGLMSKSFGDPYMGWATFAEDKFKPEGLEQICLEWRPMRRLTLEMEELGGEKVQAVEHASLPPRGWNSYDSFCWTVSEEEFLQSAETISKKLLPHGYEYVVVDYLWYRRKVPGAYVDSLGFDVIDKWGRMIPDPVRWPSSKGGKGFSEVAKKVHSMGLKFGIHVMRGISTQAVNANTPILDTTKGIAYEEGGKKWTAKDIGIKERACAWMSHGFMSVNTKSGAGRAFLRSLYEQYAEWGVDFVKHDCVFGDDLDVNEISFVSEVLKELDRPILYSLSPGTSVTPAMAKAVSGLVNMYRITGDDWDTWRDVASHFDVTRDFSTSNMVGAKGLLGKSWPDLDMLPLGWLTDPGSNNGPHRKCNLNFYEQRTQMTLWSMAKSPLMYGGDVRNLDEATLSLITNPTLLEINQFSSNNMEFPYITSTTSSKEGDTNTKRKCLSDKTLEVQVLGLTSCADTKAVGWSAEAVEQDSEQICWKLNLGNKHQTPPFCLYKRESRLTSDEDITDEQQYQGKLHLLANHRTGFCLHASPKRKITSKEYKRGSFSPCKRDANQMWELHQNGTLTNSYSGLCATVKSDEAKSNSAGVRSWIATGRKGEVYVAFFNLNPVKTVISAKMSDLAKALPGANLNDGSCKYKEVWSGKDYGIANHSISMAVETHGPALFVLNCVSSL